MSIDSKALKIADYSLESEFKPFDIAVHVESSCWLESFQAQARSFGFVVVVVNIFRRARHEKKLWQNIQKYKTDPRWYTEIKGLDWSNGLSTCELLDFCSEY